MFITLNLALVGATTICTAVAQTAEPDWQWNRDIQLAGCREVGCPNATYGDEPVPRDWDLADCSVGGAPGFGAVGVAENVFDVPDNDVQLSLTVGRTRPEGPDYPDGRFNTLAEFDFHFLIGKLASFDLNQPESVNVGCLLIWQSLFHTFTSSVKEERTNTTKCGWGLDGSNGACFKVLTDTFQRFKYDENQHLNFAKPWHTTSPRNPGAVGESKSTPMEVTPNARAGISEIRRAQTSPVSPFSGPMRRPTW
ncbi:hypothetical protein OQA88_7441 [Cercophora sp. LCS_1]